MSSRILNRFGGLLVGIWIGFNLLQTFDLNEHAAKYLVLFLALVGFVMLCIEQRRQPSVANQDNPNSTNGAKN